MNALTSIIRHVSPTWALRRIQADAAIRAYEAAQPSRLRKKRVDRGSGDSVIGAAGDSLRVQARHLDENHDLAKGVLNCLVNNVVGVGIRVEPQAKNQQGEHIAEFNKQLLRLFNDWMIRPEVTWEMHWNQVQRMVARTWFRDGETLVQILEGAVPLLDHGTTVPFSLELIEADLLPFDFNDEKRGITQGVEKNAWGRPRAYHLYKQHPGDGNAYMTRYSTKRVSADSILHPKLVERIRQTRGVSVFAAVMTRLDDIKDYEESERVAARVAAAMCAFIRKSLDAPVASDSVDAKGNRLMKMQPGMIFDNLMPGEDLAMIESNRPNNQLEQFRNSQLRAVASGTYTSFSSIAKNYNGTYSSQRQELVEQSVHYAVLREYFIERFMRPVWQRFVRTALAAGLIDMPAGMDALTLYDADFRGPSIPWIDPEREINAITLAIQAGLKARSMAIREMGNNPADTFEQIKVDHAADEAAGLTFTTSPVTSTTSNKEETDNAETKPTDDNPADETKPAKDRGRTNPRRKQKRGDS